MNSNASHIVLISWLGDSDLIAWAAKYLPWGNDDNLQPSHNQIEILAGLRGNAFHPQTPPTVEEQIERLKKARCNTWSSLIVDAIDFYQSEKSLLTIVLLSNIEEMSVRSFCHWIKAERHVQVQYTPFPENEELALSYRRCYEWAKEELAKVNPKHEVTLYFNLTSGSPAMTTSLVLLGKTTFPERSHFFISKDAKIEDCDIPFDLAVIYKRHDEALRKPLPESSAIIGSSRLITFARERAVAVAAWPQSVLLQGPNGSGKELFAQLIHRMSGRKGRLQEINCSLFSPERFQDELFGHKIGAFTGAIKDRPGIAMSADGGTLFLDEIGDCGLEVQAQLLRFLQEDPKDILSRTIFPLGADEPLPDRPKIRIIAATNKPLRTMVAKGTFREDLYYRLAALEIVIPPLRDRKEDIPELVEYFWTNMPSPPGLARPVFAENAIEALREYSWPGNVRQLKNTLTELSVNAHVNSSPIVRARDVYEVIGKHSLADEKSYSDDSSLDSLLGRVQKYWIERALDETNGNKEAAARLLGLKSGQTLTNRINSLKDVR